VAAATDGSVLLAVDLLGLETVETIDKALGKDGVKLADLAPIARLTGPISLALVVAEGSPIRSWADFVAQSKTRPLSLAHLDRAGAVGVPFAMMERELGLHFADVAAHNHSDILTALAAKQADAGFLTSATLFAEVNPSPPPVRAIVTFGAQRNRRLSQVATFQEAIGKPRSAITPAPWRCLPRTVSTPRSPSGSARRSPRRATPPPKSRRRTSRSRSKSAMPRCCTRRWRATRM
jgi:hypothetical protein